MTTHVLHIITQAERRGAETHAVELHAALAERGVDGEVWALARGRGDLDVPVLGPSTLHPRTLRALRERAQAADVVVAHGSRTLPATAMSLVGDATPAVYRSIGDPAAWSSSRTAALRVRTALGQMAAVVALWEEAADTLAERHGLERSRITVIPNAVSTPPRPVAPLPEEPSLLFVGSLTEEKRPQLALDAAFAVGLPIRVVGDGLLRHSLQRRADDRKQAATFLGNVPKGHVIDEYDRCTLLVVTSRTEGQPGVIAEAAQRGRATVACAVGGVPSMITDSRSGVLLTDRHRGPAAVASVLRGALPRAVELGAGAARDIGDHTTFASTAERWDDLLRRIAA